MLCAFSNPNVQTINPGESAVFTITEVECKRGYVRSRLGSGSFLLAGGPARRSCCCCNNQVRNYLVDVKADIGIPTGGTAGEITVALILDGTTIPATTMSVTPAAVEEYFNVSGAMIADVFRGCCESVSFRNTSDQPILMRNAYIVFDLPELDRR